MGEAAMARKEYQVFGNYISLYPWAYDGIYASADVDVLRAKKS
jgi:hypothetical protein